MNLKFFLTIFCLSTLFFVSCGDDDSTDPVDPVDCQTNGCPDGFTCTDVNGTFACVEDTTPETTVRVTSNITSDVTWTADKCYVLGGRIAVEAGATLTIEPGTLIKGEAGTGANATALLIARDAKLMAKGTAAAPIIFTSIADEITPEQIAGGDFKSPNLEPVVNGLWGGVIVLGNAPISTATDDGTQLTETQIEGIPTSDANGLYGGGAADDNSGEITYISIRHGGANIGDGNEINGLTLGGVGSGTIINNVEIVSNQDDGVEWFGGSVSVQNVVVWNTGDDALDTDMAWTGTVSNFVVVAPGDASMELDGPEGDLQGSHVIENGTVVASTADRGSNELIDLDDDSEVTLRNIWFTSINDGQQITSADAGLVTFENVWLDVPGADLGLFFDPAAPAGAAAGGSGQADTSVLGWTWAAQAGGLDGL